MRRLLPSASQTPPSCIGFPRRCEADAWEEETQAERSSRKERSGGPAGFAATRRQEIRSYSLRHGVGLNNPSVLPSARHLPLHRGGYNKVTPCDDEEPRGGLASSYIGLPPPRARSYIGFPQRFCEAKDLWEEGEQVLSWQRHGVALPTCELGNGTLHAPFPDRARSLPRETSKPSGQAARNAAEDLRALRRRGGKKLEVTPSVTVSGLTTPPSCLRQDTSPCTGEATIR